nr:hypothetical protein [Ancylobacter sp. FA202]
MDGLAACKATGRQSEDAHELGDVARLAFMPDQQMTTARKRAAGARGRRAVAADAPRDDEIGGDAMFAEFNR